VVSTGGGAVGQPLLLAALEAARRSPAPELPWLILAGFRPADEIAAMRDAAPSFVRVEPFVDDLAGVLSAARVSVSQAGYNTVCDVLAANVPAVLSPYAADGETEQARRVAALAAAGRAVLLAEPPAAAGLLAAIGRARALVPSPPPALDGAERAAALLVEAARRT
jgi:predicted glycosyltransferase